MEKEIGHQEFNPEKYGMRFCPVCNGDGKQSDDEDRVLVCPICGGFGWIRKENNPPLGLKKIPVRYGAPSY